VQSSCDERHHVWPLFLRAHTVLVETLDAELQATHGLPLSWFDVLVHLAGAPRGRMRMNELGEAVLLSRSGTTRLVDRMESAGLLTRSVSAADRRVVFAALTARGRAAYASAAPLAVRGVEEHFSRYLTRAEEKALATALSKVIAAVERKGKRRAG
jgi:DNA-binding MarR family transcriptional regulator